MEEDFANYGPLAELGLIDPKTGNAVATEDWQPPAQGQQTDQNIPPRRSDQGQGEQGQQAEQRPQTPQPSARETELERENRELRARMTPADPGRDAAANLQRRQQELQGYAQQAYHTLTTTPVMDGPNGTRVPMPPQWAQEIVGGQLRAYLAEAQLEADRAALLPTAKRAVAEELAKEYTGVTADELVSLNSVDAMRTKAETLRDARRDSSFQSRRQSNTDRAEGGSATGISLSKAMEALSPTEMVKLGVARGQG